MPFTRQPPTAVTQGPSDGQGAYLPALEFVGHSGSLADATRILASWRTDQWSDRVVAIAILLIQLHGFPTRRSRRPRVDASEDRIARFLGYEGRTPLVRRAIRRLLASGRIQVAGNHAPGKVRSFLLWLDEKRPVPTDTWDTGRPLPLYVRPPPHVAQDWKQLVPSHLAKVRKRLFP